MITVKLNETALEALQSDIERLAKRALKLNLSPVTLHIASQEYVAVKDAGGVPTGKLFTIYTVNVSGSDVKIAGWQFAATLDSNDAGTMIRKAPGFELALPTRYYEATTDCDHCHVNRYRKDVYLLYSADSQEWKQVGSTCLIDFLGHGNAESVAAYWEQVQQCIGRYAEGGDSDDEEGMGGGSGGTQYYDLAAFLAHVAACVRERGYTSAAAAREDGMKTSTANQALDNMAPPRDKKDKEAVKVTEADVQRANIVQKWAAEHFSSKPVYDRSEYEQNMAVTFASDVITRRQIGFAASAFGSYIRFVEAEIKRQKAADESTSQFVGKEGDRLKNIKVVVTFAKELDGGMYGPTYLYKMLDASGNLYVWFSSRNVLKQGDEAIVTGTVKKHEEYRGIKQTILSRCKTI